MDRIFDGSKQWKNSNSNIFLSPKQVQSAIKTCLQRKNVQWAASQIDRVLWESFTRKLVSKRMITVKNGSKFFKGKKNIGLGSKKLWFV